MSVAGRIQEYFFRPAGLNFDFSEFKDEDLSAVEADIKVGLRYFLPLSLLFYLMTLGTLFYLARFVGG